jgi:hypothetical protein
MAKKHMKNAHHPWPERKLLIKTTLRVLLTPVRTAIIKNTNNKCWSGYG